MLGADVLYMFIYLRLPFFLYYFSCFFLPADGSRQDKKITLAKKNCPPQAESLLYRFTYCKHNPFCATKRIVLKWLVLYNLISCFSIFSFTVLYCFASSAHSFAHMKAVFFVQLNTLFQISFFVQLN